MKSADEHIESIRARGDDHESHGCARHAPAYPAQPQGAGAEGAFDSKMQTDNRYESLNDGDWGGKGRGRSEDEIRYVSSSNF